MTTTDASAPDLLAAIVAATRRMVDVRSAQVSMDEMERRAAAVTPPAAAFRRAISGLDRLNVIAECKRRSPSRGVLRASYDPASIARSYEENGAAAISVLTEPTFFDGSLDHLAAARAMVSVPIIRKDFVVDRYQILEARAAGADAVLLIVSALSGSQLKTLLRHTNEAGLDALVEVHGADELAPALDAGAEIVGVNSRNLRSLSVTSGILEQLIDLMPRSVVAVAESGLKTHEDLLRLRQAGYHAFLIGEGLMSSADPGLALSHVLKGPGA
jgi:indole-3-glycerol phosphate synthase